MEITKEERIANLKKLEDFFDSDLNIKKILMDSAPTSIEKYDSQGKIDYSDRLFSNFKDLQFYFDKITKNFFNEYSDIINGKLKEIRSNIFKKGDLSSNYTKYFTNMNEEFIEEVKSYCKGYYGNRNTEKLIANSSTINELLHAMHSYIINNERILKEMPIIDKKFYEDEEINEEDNPVVVLYGEENKIAKDIFEKTIPTERNGFMTDIIALKDRILMMVRDRGHALSFEIDTTQNPIKVDYFIPKICNKNKVNNLRGIDNVNVELGTATGKFDEDEGKIADEIIDFIKKVPTDEDIVWGNTVPKFNESVIKENGNKDNKNILNDGKVADNNEEEKSLTVIEQKKNIINWIKSKFQKIKDKFKGNKEENNVENRIITETSTNKQNEFKANISENGKLKGIDEKIDWNKIEADKSNDIQENQRYE